ncbi:phospholipase D-like domain-containing protein [Paenibacillus chibensis]|uniref:phospholipase D-like domain-containing protein n=1 Tax=Paenibacillus chibensis TaxID=59846 RepID=UPI000FD73886|nr:phospholipase D-like domain-containing protein [Paenibacillus chibensis]MEC0369003.1 phospholipase D-like domain-containing protein [Paenibacillus chibensis]
MPHHQRWIALALICGLLSGCSAGSQKNNPTGANEVNRAQTQAQTSQNDASNNASSKSGKTNVQTYFVQNGDHPEQAIIGLINDAKSTLDVAVYSLNYDPIVDAIADAAGRGVRVRLVTDQEHANSKEKQQNALKRIMKAGVPVKVSSHKGKMHLKMLIADGKSVEAGSFNYLKSSVKENDDVVLIIHDEEVGKKFEDTFQRMWDDKDRYQDYESR